MANHAARKFSRRILTTLAGTLAALHISGCTMSDIQDKLLKGAQNTITGIFTGGVSSIISEAFESGN